MAVSFTNAWKDSLKDGLVVALRSSFSPSVPVYFAKKTEMRGSQFISVKGDFSNSINSMQNLIDVNFSITLDYFMQDHKRNDTSLRKFFNQVSKIEENVYSLLDIEPLFDVEIESINFTDDEEFQGYRKASFDINVNNAR